MIQKIFSFKKKVTRAFTLVELIISVGIFALLTALVVAKYGSFNSGILLTNTAYDIALVFRTAQSYGLNVKSAPGSLIPSGSPSASASVSANSYSLNYNYPYGVHVQTSAGNNTQVILFADTNYVTSGNSHWYGNGKYDPGEAISVYNLKRGTVISNLCSAVTLPCVGSDTFEDITFRRPSPDADLHRFSFSGGNDHVTVITIRATDGKTKNIIVRSTGQIAVSNPN